MKPLCLLMASVVFGSAWSNAIAGPDDLPGLIQLAEKSIVKISTPTGHGTGFVIADGIVATNFHVVANTVVVTVEHGKIEETCDVSVFANKEQDLVLLKVVKLTLPPLKLREKQLKKGEAAVVIGHPEGLDGTVTRGIVSAIRTSDELQKLSKSGRARAGEWIQIDAAINDGNSGGPVLDAVGHVIGIATSSLIDTENINFAVSYKSIALALRQQKVTPLKTATVSEPVIANASDVPFDVVDSLYQKMRKRYPDNDKPWIIVGNRELESRSRGLKKGEVATKSLRDMLQVSRHRVGSFRIQNGRRRPTYQIDRKVFQVIDAQNALIQHTHRTILDRYGNEVSDAKFTYEYYRMNTAGLVDGEPFGPGVDLKIGTKQYNTVGGGSSTVPYIYRANAEEVAAALKRFVTEERDKKAAIDKKLASRPKPNPTASKFRLAEVYIRSKKVEKAIELLKSIVDTEPDSEIAAKAKELLHKLTD